MDIKLVVAIIRSERLEATEEQLQAMGVERVNVSKVKGYGEYHNFFSRTWMLDEVRLEIFTRADEVEKITRAILDAAHTGVPGDGVVAVLPVEQFFLVRTGTQATAESFWPRNA
ncbi:MAG: P-II family nitrogen regulator [Betaproteobacteria bacterium]